MSARGGRARRRGRRAIRRPLPARLRRAPRPVLALVALGLAAVLGAAGVTALRGPADDLPSTGSGYPWHTGIVATTFWVGEIFDPEAEDGSQERSAWDADWMSSYGGCYGVVVDGVCETEPRAAADGWFPSSTTPLENPFYVDVPFDDVNHPEAFAARGAVVPWAQQPGYAELIDDRGASLLKNRWVMLHREGRVCFAQVQDAGPGEYDDADYVFGGDDARPANERYNGAGMDVSPAVNGCLGFADLNGQDDLIDWRFVDDDEVPEGPWTRVVTTSGVNLG